MIISKKKNQDVSNLSDISSNKFLNIIEASKQELPNNIGKNNYILQQYNTHTNLLSSSQINTNLSNLSSSNNVKNCVNALNTNDSYKFKNLSQNGNISQIIDIDNSMPDESLINNKEDLFITSPMNDNEFNFNNSVINNLMGSLNFNSPNKAIKLEFDEVLDDRWAIFEQ